MKAILPLYSKPRGAGGRRWRGVDAFTLIELLVVISIIATLAGLVVGLAPTVSERIKESRIRAELADLETAIDGYHAKFGIYPPDNGHLAQADSQTDWSGVSPLFYELSGVFVDNANQVFLTADGNQTIKPAEVSRIFGRDGFVNAAVKGRRRQFAHRINDRQHAGIFRNPNAQIGGNLEILAVGFSTDGSGKRGAGFPWPTDAKTLGVYPPPFPAFNGGDSGRSDPNPGLNPWHYVSTSPTNNPGGYDLWAEYFVHGERRVIANWKQ